MRRSLPLGQLTPGRIAILYAMFGLVWIFLSDIALHQVAQSRQTLSAIQSVKGGVFVALSGAVIWGLTSRREEQLRESRARLQRTSQRLHVLQRVFRHNIRNDMNVIKGCVDLVREDLETPSRAERLAAASETADDVIEISEKLKVIDRYGVQTEIEGHIDVVRVIEGTIRTIRTNYPGVSIQTDLPDTAPVLGDEAIHYIFEEVVENAIEHFDGPNEELSIQLTVDRSGDAVVATIADNGPGIPPGELAAFDQRAESSLVHLSSVGLWMVYWLCERVGADFDLTTDPGGTEVRIAFRHPDSFPALEIVGDEFLAELG